MSKFEGLLINKGLYDSIDISVDDSHFIYFNILFTDNKIIKIGQYPSIADIEKADISKYKSILKSKCKEYSTAVLKSVKYKKTEWDKTNHIGYKIIEDKYRKSDM